MCDLICFVFVMDKNVLRIFRSHMFVLLRLHFCYSVNLHRNYNIKLSLFDQSRQRFASERVSSDNVGIIHFTKHKETLTLPN